MTIYVILIFNYHTAYSSTKLNLRSLYRLIVPFGGGEALGADLDAVVVETLFHSGGVFVEDEGAHLVFGVGTHEISGRDRLCARHHAEWRACVSHKG